jgi:hypothetical protein
MPQIQVFGKPGFGVLDNGIPADHQIPNAVGVEKSQQIAEVGVDEHQDLLPWRSEELTPKLR